LAPVRAAAAQKLTTDLDPRSGKALAAATSHKEWLVRASAVSALARRGDPKLASPVIPLWTTRTIRFDSTPQRR
jgi:HEAT repeat protein